MKIWGHNCTAQIKYFSKRRFQIVCLKVADPKGTWDSLWIDGSYASNGDITVFFGAEMISPWDLCGGRVPTRDVLNKCQGLFGVGAQQFIENNRTRTL